MLPVELLMLYYDSLRFFIIFTVTKELNAFILSIDYKIISTDKVCFFFLLLMYTVIFVSI